MPKIVAMIQAARDKGQDVSANMYPYVAGGTALASSLPPWVAEGGTNRLLARLQDHTIRTKIKQARAGDHPNWENLYFDSGGPSGALVSGIVTPDCKNFDCKSMGQTADAKRQPHV